MEKKIAQISDIHFGEKNFSSRLRENLVEQLQDENPDLIVVSGDLTTEGYAHEYELAAEFADGLRSITPTCTFHHTLHLNPHHTQ